jgi:hypothetical protein
LLSTMNWLPDRCSDVLPDTLPGSCTKPGKEARPATKSRLVFALLSWMLPPPPRHSRSMCRSRPLNCNGTHWAFAR